LQGTDLSRASWSVLSVNLLDPVLDAMETRTGADAPPPGNCNW